MLDVIQLKGYGLFWIDVHYSEQISLS